MKLSAKIRQLFKVHPIVLRRNTNMTIRHRFTADLKAKVALEALRSDETTREITAEYNLPPNQVCTWKR